MNFESTSLDVTTGDELTGLLNQRGFNLLADYLLVAAQRRAEPLSIACFNLDGLSQINNTWGHEEGDKTLVAMASLMKTAFRVTDVISRSDGDEFIIIFADTDEAGAFIALEYLSEQAAEFNRISGMPWQLRYSVGIAEYFEREHACMADTIQSARREMLKIKAARNKLSSH